MAPELGLRVDCAVGEAVSWVVKNHHRRRLTRIGWLRALEAAAGGWADGSPGPRTGCSLELLIDGAEALPRIVAELEAARSHIHLAGWHFTPHFALTRDRDPPVLRN